MSLASMTGFARASGANAAWRWAWELKSVNAKGLDLRLRLPPGFDAIETEVRARLGKRLSRGAVYASLSATREKTTPVVRVNADVLASLIAAVSNVPGAERLAPPSLDGLLAVRGVVDVVDEADDEATMREAQAAALAGLDGALTDLLAMRRSEGAALGDVLARRLDRIAELTRAADDNPARKPEAVREKLAASIRVLTDGSTRFDEARLHQEALLLASKADIREELDRLVSHVAAARELLGKHEAVGRRLDFLAQEFGREANTLCAKSNDVSLTALGLELRAEIEQFREQVQNIE